MNRKPLSMNHRVLPRPDVTSSRCVFAFCLVMTLSGTVTAWAQEFVCEPAEDWTTLLDRESGWLAGDGIFTIDMQGDARHGTITPDSKTIFLFSDSFFGKATPDYRFSGPITMVNHCVAVLQGDRPDQSKMEFHHNCDPEGKPTNLFDRGYWLGDGIVIDSMLYTTGTVVDPSDWSMEGPWLITVPIRNGTLDFSRSKSQRVNLAWQSEEYNILFGIGILDCGDDIYVYGFRDKTGVMFYPRQLLVAKAPRRTFGEIETWRFWTGSKWSENITDLNTDDAALAEGMSNELSVTLMHDGPFRGKYLLVYTEGCVSPNLNFAVSDSPFGKFTQTTTFYRCPEVETFAEAVKKDYGEQASIVTYNAKAHPRLSRPDELIVSYNLNIFGLNGGFFSDKRHAFPRFVRLRFPER